MEEKNINYEYLFDDRELEGLENIEELDDAELENILSNEEKEKLEEEIEESTKEIQIKYET